MTTKKSSWGSTHKNMSPIAMKRRAIKTKVHRECNKKIDMSTIEHSNVVVEHKISMADTVWNSNTSEHICTGNIMLEYQAGYNTAIDVSEMGGTHKTLILNDNIGTVFGVRFYRDNNRDEYVLISDEFPHITEIVNYMTTMEKLANKVQTLKEREKKYKKSWECRSKDIEILELISEEL